MCGAVVAVAVVVVVVAILVAVAVVFSATTLKERGQPLSM